MDQPPLLVEGAHRSLAYDRSRPRRLAVTAREGQGARQGSVYCLAEDEEVTWRPSDNGEGAAVVALSESDAQAWREGKENRWRCGGG
jgi:hypothetical protein